MSRIVVGYDRDGHTLYADQGPARGALSTSRGGLTLGQALTAVAETPDVASVRPVGAGTPDAVPVRPFSLRGEALLRSRRRR